MTRRVLFVNDEPQVLEGLRHRLHRQRKYWQMHFATSGRAALEILATEPIDIIVTDMWMPQMDGAAVLRHVQELYPRTVRIVLSGHADLETALRAVPVAHQFLNKPSEPGVIESVVERACSLQSLINADMVKQTVGKIERLPSLPSVYSQLLAVLADEATTNDDVARILKQDMAICAKTLQVANSALDTGSGLLAQASCEPANDVIRTNVTSCSGFLQPSYRGGPDPIGMTQRYRLVNGRLVGESHEVPSVDLMRPSLSD